MGKGGAPRGGTYDPSDQARLYHEFGAQIRDQDRRKLMFLEFGRVPDACDIGLRGRMRACLLALSRERKVTRKQFAAELVARVLPPAVVAGWCDHKSGGTKELETLLRDIRAEPSVHSRPAKQIVASDSRLQAVFEQLTLFISVNNKGFPAGDVARRLVLSAKVQDEVYGLLADAFDRVWGMRRPQPRTLRQRAPTPEELARRIVEAVAPEGETPAAWLGRDDLDGYFSDAASSPPPWDEELRARARRYLDQLGSGPTLVLHGEPGSGKKPLAHAIVHEALHGRRRRTFALVAEGRQYREILGAVVGFLEHHTVAANLKGTGGRAAEPRPVRGGPPPSTATDLARLLPSDLALRRAGELLDGWPHEERPLFVLADLDLRPENLETLVRAEGLRQLGRVLTDNRRAQLVVSTSDNPNQEGTPDHARDLPRPLLVKRVKEVPSAAIARDEVYRETLEHLGRLAGLSKKGDGAGWALIAALHKLGDGEDAANEVRHTRNVGQKIDLLARRLWAVLGREQQGRLLTLAALVVVADDGLREDSLLRMAAWLAGDDPSHGHAESSAVVDELLARTEPVILADASRGERRYDLPKEVGDIRTLDVTRRLRRVLQRALERVEDGRLARRAALVAARRAREHSRHARLVRSPADPEADVLLRDIHAAALLPQAVAATPAEADLDWPRGHAGAGRSAALGVEEAVLSGRAEPVQMLGWTKRVLIAHELDDERSGLLRVGGDGLRLRLHLGLLSPGRRIYIDDEPEALVPDEMPDMVRAAFDGRERAAILAALATSTLGTGHFPLLPRLIALADRLAAENPDLDPALVRVWRAAVDATTITGSTDWLSKDARRPGSPTWRLLREALLGAGQASPLERAGTALEAWCDRLKDQGNPAPATVLVRLRLAELRYLRGRVDEALDTFAAAAGLDDARGPPGRRGAPVMAGFGLRRWARALCRAASEAETEVKREELLQDAEGLLRRDVPRRLARHPEETAATLVETARLASARGRFAEALRWVDLAERRQLDYGVSIATRLTISSLGADVRLGAIETELGREQQASLLDGAERALDRLDRLAGTGGRSPRFARHAALSLLLRAKLERARGLADGRPRDEAKRKLREAEDLMENTGYLLRWADTRRELELLEGTQQPRAGALPEGTTKLHS